ncbi:MAG: hypothetical protein LC737_00895 [Chloroflexi bacterium]|nr:hypothetical protein [Chloroflexota bacterium]
MNSNRFSNMVAVLIALVTVVGAIVAWRVSVALSDAGSADTAGLLAVVDNEDATTHATVYALGHQTAYAAFLRDDRLARALRSLGDQYTTFANSLDQAATRALDYVPRAYLDRDENYNVQRDVGEDVAESTLNKDVNSRAKFDAADASRGKAQWLLLTLIGLGTALLFLTSADAVQNALRYLLLLGGLALFAASALGALVVELVLSHS